MKLYQACKLLDFFQNKEANHSEENLFFKKKKNLLLPNLETDIDLDHQIDVVINLKLENLTLETVHFQSMIMQHLLDENTHKKLDSCIDNKIF